MPKGGRVVLQSVFFTGLTLPPPRRAVQPFVEWLFAVPHALCVLGLLHPGLLAANQSQRLSHASSSIDSAIAEGKLHRDAGLFSEAVLDFTSALTLAREQKDLEKAARCLILLAAAQVRTFQYRSALQAALEASRLARQMGNLPLAGAASVNISTIYTQLGDFTSAEEEAARAVDFLQQIAKPTPQARQFLVKALLGRASLCFMQSKTAEGKKWSDAGIALAKQTGDSALEALAWESLGTALLREKDVPAAAVALHKEFDLRTIANDQDGLAVTKEHLAELELLKPAPDYQAGLVLINQAFSDVSPSFKSNSQYYPIHIRGEILLKLGDENRALAEFRKAVISADQWRLGALPGDTTNSQTVASLQRVYQDFALLAARISLKNHDAALGREAFEVLAENRAAGLREELTLALGRDFRLPDAYFKKLSELQTAQARVTLGGDGREDKADLARIRLAISNLENQIGIETGKSYLPLEKNLRKNSLKDIQSRLGVGRLLLSYCLGNEQSFLWAITGDQVNLSELPSESIVLSQATHFAAAVSDGHGFLAAGRTFSQTLFGTAPAQLLNRAEWLIVADAALTSGIPFAALPEPSANSSLLARHSLRFLPSELLLLTPESKPPKPRFIGVADPIYNFADSRLRSLPDAKERSASIALARLAGSDKEVRTAARLSGAADLQILTGLQATADELKKSLAIPPAVLHFAVHVVSPPGRPQEAALALSMKEGLPELLTAEAIATLRVPGSLIVLSGCSSDQGKALPGAGLIGLSRAWLLAGAAAVVVSAWPTPDDSGHFFASFYSHLQKSDPGHFPQRAARALQQTQLDMQRSSGFTSSPGFWAAYSIISKE